MKYCPKCGKDFDDSWSVCLYDQSPLRASPVSTGASPSAPPTSDSSSWKIQKSITGLVSGGISASLTALVLFLVYANARQSHGASAWLTLYPLLWNMPLSTVVVIIHKLFRAPDFITGPLLVGVAFIQWYVLGLLIEKLPKSLVFVSTAARRDKRKFILGVASIMLVFLAINVIYELKPRRIPSRLSSEIHSRGVRVPAKILKYSETWPYKYTRIVRLTIEWHDLITNQSSKRDVIEQWAVPTRQYNTNEEIGIKYLKHWDLGPFKTYYVISENKILG